MEESKSKSTRRLSLWQCIQTAFGDLKKWQRIFVGLAFLLSLAFTIYGIVQEVKGDGSQWLVFCSVMMSIFGFLGTWTLAVQYQGTFWVNGIQNIFGIIVGVKQRIYGDAFTSCYYLATEFIGHYSWLKRRDDQGRLHVSKESNFQVLAKAVVFWFLILSGISYLLGGQQIILDGLTNAISFVAQYRQVRGYKDGYYLWLVNDVFSFILWFRAGNMAVAYSYLAMLAQGVAGLMIWQEGESDADKLASAD